MSESRSSAAPTPPRPTAAWGRTGPASPSCRLGSRQSESPSSLSAVKSASPPAKLRPSHPATTAPAIEPGTSRRRRRLGTVQGGQGKPAQCPPAVLGGTRAGKSASTATGTTRVLLFPILQLPLGAPGRGQEKGQKWKQSESHRQFFLPRNN